MLYLPFSYSTNRRRVDLMRNSLTRFIRRNPICLAIVVSISCGVLLTRLPKFGNSFRIEEDTIETGRTPVFIHPKDFFGGMINLPDVLKELGLPMWRIDTDLGSHYWTSVPAGRSDSRESMVYAFAVDSADLNEASSDPGLAIGVTIAKSLARVPWLAKAIQIVFFHRASSPIPETASWLDEIRRSKPGFVDGLPLIRGAVVVDIRVGSEPNPLEVSVEGSNGALPNQDFANVLLEVSKELNIPVNVKSIFDAISVAARNGGASMKHSPFIDAAIPSFTLSSVVRPESSTATLTRISQLIGKHIRAASGLHHQLHHSTSWYFYSGSTRDVSLGVFIPLLLGFLSPLFVSILDPRRNNESLQEGLILVGLALSGPLMYSAASSVAIRVITSSDDSNSDARHAVSYFILILTPLAHASLVRNGFTHITEFINRNKRMPCSPPIRTSFSRDRFESIFERNTEGLLSRTCRPHGIELVTQLDAGGCCSPMRHFPQSY